MPDNQEHCRRLAAQIFAQLPEDRDEALLTLRYAREILLFLGDKWTRRPARPVTLFPQMKGLVVVPANDPEDQTGSLDTASPG